MIKHAYSKKHVLLALNSEMLISLFVNFDGGSWEWLGSSSLQMGTRGYAVGAYVCAGWVVIQGRLEAASDLLLMCPGGGASTPCT